MVTDVGVVLNDMLRTCKSDLQASELIAHTCKP